MSKRSPLRDSDRGFSLLEILVVITILGVLATVVVFSVRSGADDAEAAAVAADARVLETAQAAYAVSAGHYGEEDELVAAGHLRQPSALHDIVLEGDGFRLVRTDGTVPSGDSDETASGGDGGSNGGAPGGSGSQTTLPATTVPATTLPTTTVPATTLPTTTVPATTLPTTTLPTTTLPTTTVPTTTAPAGGPVTCAFTITQAWSSGANGQLTIENATDKKLTAWTVAIETGGDKISLWSADTVSSGRGRLTARNERWNGTVAAGTTATPTGGSIEGKQLRVGQAYPCEIVTPQPSLDDLDCSLDVTRTWWGGGSVRLTVENDGKVDVSSWTVEVEAEDVTFTSWSGVDVSATGKHRLTLTSQDWTSYIEARDEQRSVTAQASGKLDKKQSFDCEVVEAS